MKIEFSYQTSVLTLPGAVAEKLESASEQDLRVLIYLAAHPEFAEDFNSAKLAVELNISDREIEQSVAFWRGAGILKSGKGGKKSAAGGERAEKRKSADHSESNIKESEKDGAEDQAEADIRSGAPIVATRVGDLPVYTGAEIEQMMRERKKLKNLLIDTQNILGKVFNVSESNKIIALSNYLRLSDDYILLLCSYCVSRDRASVPYVVKEAGRLYDAGIQKYTQLEEYIATREKQNDFNNFIRHLSGIGDRVLTPYEEKTFEKWASFEYSREIIVCAYQISVDSTAKFAFRHMDKILQTWHDAGVRTLEDAKAHTAAHQAEMKKLYAPKWEGKKAEINAENREQTDGFDSFDTDAFFNAALEKGKKALKKGTAS